MVHISLSATNCYSCSGLGHPLIMPAAPAQRRTCFLPGGKARHVYRRLNPNFAAPTLCLCSEGSGG